MSTHIEENRLERERLQHGLVGHASKGIDRFVALDDDKGQHGPGCSR